MKILITGATGMVGRATVLALLGAGHQVRAWVRRPNEAQQSLGPAVEVVQADPSKLREALSGMDAVINLAGEPVMGRRWNKAHLDALWKSRVTLTEAIVEALGPNGPRVLLSASAVGYYGDGGAETLLEDHPQGEGYLAELCAAWERAALAAEAKGVRVAVFRIGLVLGPAGFLAPMLPAFDLGVGLRIGPKQNFLPWIHLEDQVAILLAALDAPWSGPFNCAAPEPATNNDFAATLGQLMKRPVLPLPQPILRAALGPATQSVTMSQRAVPHKLLAARYVFRHPDLTQALIDVLGTNLAVTRASTPDQPYFRRFKGVYGHLAMDTQVASDQATVAAFFQDPRNLAVLTPPGMDFEIRTTPEVMAAGAKVAFRVGLGPVPVTWQGEIEDWTPGRGFVDVQLRGPYRGWWHAHSFEPQGDGAVIRDRVWYALPFWPLGQVAHPLVRNQMQRLFAYRRLASRLYLGRIK